MLEHCVKFPLGVVLVTLDRWGLGLAERGGFTAAWTVERSDLNPEAYRLMVKQHLKEVYVAREGAEPSAVTLNLASHQLLDDIVGWTKLNLKPS